MPNSVLTKNFRAGATIARRIVVKHGADDTTVIPATSSTDLIIGVAEQVDCASGNPVDVILCGVADCVAGAAVARGARLTVDGSGRVITAAPAVGVNAQLIGIAMAAATAANDVIPVLLERAVMQG
jgi:hypothetical protein